MRIKPPVSWFSEPIDISNHRRLNHVPMGTTTTATTRCSPLDGTTQKIKKQDTTILSTCTLNLSECLIKIKTTYINMIVNPFTIWSYEWFCNYSDHDWSDCGTNIPVLTLRMVKGQSLRSDYMSTCGCFRANCMTLRHNHCTNHSKISRPNVIVPKTRAYAEPGAKPMRLCILVLLISLSAKCCSLIRIMASMLLAGGHPQSTRLAS